VKDYVVVHFVSLSSCSYLKGRTYIAQGLYYTVIAYHWLKQS
jgi:hypothetical protein